MAAKKKSVVCPGCSRKNSFRIYKNVNDNTYKVMCNKKDCWCGPVRKTIRGSVDSFNKGLINMKIKHLSTPMDFVNFISNLNKFFVDG